MRLRRADSEVLMPWPAPRRDELIKLLSSQPWGDKTHRYFLTRERGARQPRDLPPSMRAVHPSPARCSCVQQSRCTQTSAEPCMHEACSVMQASRSTWAASSLRWASGEAGRGGARLHVCTASQPSIGAAASCPCLARGHPPLPAWADHSHCGCPCVPPQEEDARGAAAH